ncbi:hypothetical protein N7509_002273 [Penicillium cosmopolitanum]|uniref:Uncharacterized protein n=1 Tax=Penicillium cosmopolitanum TaxID=1131564 RepID=A0A9X0BDA6_9EURO|nr:uncharacterized protein N7509_002273 [Penicillium cosmopolitanum]KAJ5408390.1 hypothetical protein N7509_002273 [Penicillium cosmopolitanum]
MRRKGPSGDIEARGEPKRVRTASRGGTVFEMMVSTRAIQDKDGDELQERIYTIMIPERTCKGPRRACRAPEDDRGPSNPPPRLYIGERAYQEMTYGFEVRNGEPASQIRMIRINCRPTDTLALSLESSEKGNLCGLEYSSETMQ